MDYLTSCSNRMKLQTSDPKLYMKANEPLIDAYNMYFEIQLCNQLNPLSQLNSEVMEMVVMSLFFFLFADMETNECLTNNGGCWHNKDANVSACRVFHFSNIYLYWFSGNFLCIYLCILELYRMHMQLRIHFEEEFVNVLLFEV